MRSNIIIAGGLLLFGAIVIAGLRTQPLEGVKHAVTEQGVVTDIYEAGMKDLVLKINGKARAYYLDQGLDKGFDLDELKRRLLNKKVVVKYEKHTAGFTTESTTRYISQLHFDDEVLYADE